MREEWRDIPNYPGYQASSIGRIRKLRPSGVYRIVKGSRDKKGYRRIGISNTTRIVAHLIAETFLGPRPLGFVCCHKNGDNSNDSVFNLRWDTHKGNMLDKIIHGQSKPITHKGSFHPLSKLTEDKVSTILDKLLAGATNRSVAKEYSLSESTISKIRTGRLWRHVEGIRSPKWSLS